MTLDEDIQMYEDEINTMNEELQKIEQHMLITQQEYRRLQFTHEDIQQEIKDTLLRIERENDLRKQKAQKAA